MKQEQDANYRLITKVIRQMTNLLVMLSLVVIGMASYAFYHYYSSPVPQNSVSAPADIPTSTATVTPTATASDFWSPPDVSALDGLPDSEKILYGKSLIAQTALYFGPQGTVKKNAINGMNCQNCHLDAGTRVFGNNYGSVFSTYPKYRARSGTEEDIFKRVNDCFERSLNGLALDTNSKEMEAIVAYIHWLGKDVPKGEKAKGSGLKDLPLLDRAADPEKGKTAYGMKCQSCHLADGQGQLNPEKTAYAFPPLWGENSYNTGAGLYRISNFAKYIKYNMPLGATHENPQLSDEEAWDIAAYVNSQPRPAKDISKDWPKIAEKPFDHPFGPYADKFSEQQHKYGPFGDMVKK